MVCPPLDPPRYATPDVHALYGDTRLYMGESLARIPSELGKRMFFSPLDTCLDVRHRLPSFLRQSQTVAQFANSYRRDQLRSIPIETRNRLSNRLVIWSVRIIKNRYNTRIQEKCVHSTDILIEFHHFFLGSRRKGLQCPRPSILRCKRAEVFMESQIGGEVLRKPAAKFMPDPAHVFLPAEKLKKFSLQTRRQVVRFQHLCIDLDKRHVLSLVDSWRVQTKPCEDRRASR